MADVLLNGVDVAELGFGVARVEGFRRGPEAAWTSVSRPQMPGAVPVGRTYAPRPIDIVGSIKGDSLEDLQERLDQLVGLAAARQPCEIVLAGLNDAKKIEADFREPYVTEMPGGQWAILLWDLSLSFVATRNPFWQELTATDIGPIQTTPVALPQGTGPSYPVVRIAGPATDPVVIVRDRTGAEYGRMGFTATLSNGEYLVIDTRRFTVYRNTTGLPNVGDSVPHLWTSGEFFHVPTEVFNHHAEAWPSAACSSGSARFIYPRQWL